MLRIELDGRPVRRLADDADAAAAATGVIGADVAARDVSGDPRTVVQLLLDDDRPGFDASLLDGPLVAELVGPDGEVAAREPFDHDRFRRKLAAEHAAGESTTRGVLARVGGELPPPWVRLAFLPVELGSTAGSTLVVRRTTVDELEAAVEQAFEHGAVTDAERLAMLVSIDQLHPGVG